MSPSLRRNIFVCVLPLILVLTLLPVAMVRPDGIGDLAQELSTIVQLQARAWNEGNIDDFMQAYWKSEDLTFSSGGTTERGWEATKQRYLSRYPTREVMGKLTFSQLEVTPLGEQVAMMLGRWHLDRSESIGGNFSLIWRKFDTVWLIVHDHSSVQLEK